MAFVLNAFCISQTADTWVNPNLHFASPMVDGSPEARLTEAVRIVSTSTRKQK